jgi:hypothetical protein
MATSLASAQTSVDATITAPLIIRTQRAPRRSVSSAAPGLAANRPTA